MLTGVATVLLLLVVLLAIPVTLTYQVYWHKALQSDIDLRWAFGLVRVRIPSPQPKKTSPRDKKQGGDRSKRSSKKTQNVFAAVRQLQFRRRIMRFITDLWHAVHKKDLSLRLRIGLGDPAETGQLWAIFGPLAGILANVQQASIIIEPDFVDTTFELDSSGTIRINPLQMIYLAVALLLSPPVWRGIRQMRVAGN